MTVATEALAHPASESEVVALVRRAARTGRALRVGGSLHSIPPAIHALDRLRAR